MCIFWSALLIFKGWMLLEAAASVPSAVFSVEADRDKWLLFEAAEGQ